MTMLLDGTVRVIHADLDESWHAGLQEDLLTPHELRRIEQIHNPRLYQRAVCARALLRSILGHIRAEPAQMVPVETNAYGKPFCLDGPAFNVAHSQAHMVIVLADSGQVGIDIEYVKPCPEMEEIAKSHFSRHEQQQLMQHHGDARLRAFYRAWTRKEALVKALGEGLSLPLNKFSVDLDIDAANVLVQSTTDRIDINSWSILPLPGEPSMPVAIAASFTIETIVEHRYQYADLSLQVTTTRV